MNKRKQKESLSLRITKIILAVVITTGLGTIIIGGGVVIMKYYNSGVNNRMAKPVDQETGLNIATNDQDLIFEKILCEPEKDYVFNYGIEGDKSKLPCRDCPNGYIFQATHTSFHLTSELGISHKTEIKSCVKIKYRTINELNEKDVKIGNYNTEGYIVWESTCKGLSRAERSVCAVKPKEIIISKNNETIEDETELTNNQLRVINPGDGQIEIGSKYRFLLRLEEIGSDDNKFKYFKGIRFEKIEDDKPNTSDWQTYRNEEFGFEVKYPENWEHNFKNRYSPFQGSALMENSVAFRPINDYSNADFEVAFSSLPIKNNDYCLNDKEETIYINNVKAVKCELSLDPNDYKDVPAFGYEGDLGTKIFFSKDSSHNYVIYFIDETMSEYEIVLNQILSTFKFTD